MKIKSYIKRDGLGCVALAVKFTITKDEIITALCIMLDGDKTNQEKITQKAVFAKIKTELYLDSNGFLESNPYGTTINDELRAKATETAKEMFPEFFVDYRKEGEKNAN